jgi:hypothetical protein
MDADYDSTSSDGSDFHTSFDPYRRSRDIIGRSDRLPVSHDTSWIGARVSPIAFDEEDEEKLAPYKQALNDSMANERSALLGIIKRGDRSKIHPMWDDGNPLLFQTTDTDDRLRGFYHWGNVVLVISGSHLLAMAIHDFYVAYLSYRLGYDVDVERWSLPWLYPSTASLQRFGAFMPYQALEHAQWWRMLTSTFMSTSVAQWLLVLWSWRALQWGGARPTRKWCYLYLLAVFTGQIWMMAFDFYGIAGAATWGSSGVICAAGGARPKQRFMLFITAIVIIILSLVEPTNSVVGTIGGSFFGWTFYGLGWSSVVSKMDKGTVKPKGMLRLLSGLALLKLWVVPVLFVAFRAPQSTLSQHQ